MLKCHLFGPPHLLWNEKTIEINLRKGLALVAYLAVTRQPHSNKAQRAQRAPALHSRDALATLFWPELDQRNARGNLRRLLYNLNQLLPVPLLETSGETVYLHPELPVWVDVAEFQARLAEAAVQDTPDGVLPAAALDLLVEAATLYTDDFLAGFTLADCPEFDDWQYFTREELRQEFSALLARLDWSYAGGGQLSEALPYARRRLALDPLDEAAHRRLMELYALTGQRRAALRQYDECVRILAAELDATPEDETIALYASIRSQRFPSPSQQDNARPDTQSAIEPPTPAIVPPTGLPAAPQGAVDAPPAHATVAPSYNLPQAVTPFVGRKTEVAEVLRRLRDPDCRLLTLVGPGGIGKTRLALEVARRFAGTDHPGAEVRPDVCFVALQAVSNLDGMVAVIAEMLGFQFFGSESPQTQLFAYLRDKRMLLVLDNFEHLLPWATLATEILTAAPNVRLLVTSREALKLYEEWFHPLTGLRLPPQASSGAHNAERVARPVPDVTAENATPSDALTSAITADMTSDAVQLFIQTARRAAVNFQPEAEREHINHICRLVDGMPLAIELAAAWLNSLSCAEIAAEIAHGMDILTTRYQNIPERHRSMRVVLDQSWQLLSQEAKQVLAALSIFQGSFDHEAATFVMQTAVQDATGAHAGRWGLVELVEKAWVYRTPTLPDRLPGTLPDDESGAGVQRYQLHELLRQFAAAKLDEDPTRAAEMQNRHADFYIQFLARCAPQLGGSQQRHALDGIGANFENIRAAWLWSAQCSAWSWLDQALEPLYQFLFIRSRYTTGEALFQQALAQMADSAPEEVEEPDAREIHARVRLRLLARLGAFRLHQGDLAGAEANFETILSESADPSELTFACLMSGHAARFRGDRAHAEAAMRRGLALAQAAQSPVKIAEALLALSDVENTFGDYEDGRQHALEALKLCRALARPDLTAQVLASLAWATNCLGDYAESERYYQESLELAEELGNPFGIALAIQFLGWVVYCEGGARLPEALARYEQAMATYRQIGHHTNLAMAYGDYALAAGELGDYDRALRYSQEGLALTESLDHRDLMAYNLFIMGGAYTGLGDFAAARQALYRALQAAAAAHIPTMLAAALYFLAQLEIKESEVATLPDAEHLAKRTQALEWLALVIAYRPTWQAIRDRAQRLQTTQKAQLPPDHVQAVLQRSRHLSVETAVAAILSRAEPSPHGSISSLERIYRPETSF